MTKFYSLENDEKPPTISEKKNIAGKLIKLENHLNQEWFISTIKKISSTQKINWSFVDGNSMDSEKLQKSKTQFISIKYLDDEKKCRNKCDRCENGKKCGKKKANKVPFFLYKKGGKFFLIYFSNIIFNDWEIIHHIYNFIYSHGESIITTKKIYDFKNKRLIDTEFNKFDKLIESEYHNKGLLKTCHLEMTSVRNEPYRIFCDTEGRPFLPREVAFMVYCVGKKDIIKKMDSRDSTIDNVIQELNKWLKKDCIIYTHNTDHDVKKILETIGLKYRPTTKFCCTSSNSGYKDLDTLCENFEIIVDQNKRHTAIYDSELLYDCFLKSKKKQMFTPIKYYKNHTLKI